ncbi:flagellar protein FlaG [Paenibacillus sp. Soil766]|uniref:flagellar protein FlaG n=1 Tax=Paenibacillus sp. Soil766 TaxID=1736404 RepID=UPI0007C7ECEA|nr:flagellar protein FlaG [Paenibacillus sp. Soil766]
MSSDMSLGGLGRSAATELSYANNTTQRVAETPTVSPDSSSTTAVAGMTSTKEVRTAELQGQKVALGDELLIKAIERANKAAQGITTTFEFKIHEATKQIMVKVLDKDTGEIVREIPPEKVLDMVAKLWEKAGIIVDERR